jgi:hypothetical protein
MNNVVNDISETLDYLEPEYPINDDWMTHLKSKVVNLTPVIKSMYGVLKTLITDIQNNALKSPPDHYRWSLYDQLEIPSRSYIVRPYRPEQTDDNNIFYFLSDTIAEYIKIPKCRLFVNPIQKENLFMSINTDAPSIPTIRSLYGYKVHLVCKPEYILYAFMKLLYLRNLEILGLKYRLQTKVNLDSRAHLPSEYDTGLLSDELNGGAAATIVIYAGEEPKIAKALILAVLNLFKDEYDIIGGMERLEAPFVIPTFNVRLNPLIAYASGDRETRCNFRRANAGLQEYNPEYPKGSFKTPKWVKEYRETCTKETAEEINTKALRLFGHKLCTPDGSPAPDPVPCGICYMTSERQEPMITPFELMAEPAPDAAAPAPDAAVRVACGGAGCGAPAAATGSPRRGGSRHTKRRSSKRSKTRRHKRR